VPEYVSVNVGPATLVDGRFLELLEARGRGPIVVELTEHAVIEDYETVSHAVDRLHQLGVRIAVDDAGSGFASLRHVISLAPDIIKLDQALICSIDQDPRRRTLATTLATFASEIGSELIAEGIEREEELRVCEEIGIRYGQGFLLGRPGNTRPGADPADREDCDG
jgi:EAL domain-containing protein (putative c-di-GMP-specific phosphodiesterase class I)